MSMPTLAAPKGKDAPGKTLPAFQARPGIGPSVPMKRFTCLVKSCTVSAPLVHVAASRSQATALVTRNMVVSSTRWPLKNNNNAFGEGQEAGWS